jgi:hypothetical protein
LIILSSAELLPKHPLAIFTSANEATISAPSPLPPGCFMIPSHVPNSDWWSYNSN